MNDEPELSTREALESLQAVMIARATGSPRPALPGQYEQLRERLLSDGTIGALVPSFVRTCRTLDQFWAHIRQTSGYADRRRVIWEAFAPALDAVERSAPLDRAVAASLAVDTPDKVRDGWQRALDRRATDPEGAITSARTLLESVCKYVLEQRGESYEEKDDLPKLYRRTAKALRLSPDQHAEAVFKQILGGCAAVVEGLGAARNRLGDAHGKSANSARPAPRHAELAVNLAGTMSVFLIETLRSLQDQA